MQNPKLIPDGAGGIDALIRCFVSQRLFAEVVIAELEQAKADRTRVKEQEDDLALMREREVRRLERLV